MQQEYPHRAAVGLLDYQQRVLTPGERRALQVMEEYRKVQAQVPYTPGELAEVERLNREQGQSILDYYDHGKDIRLDLVRDRVAAKRREITRAARARGTP